MLTRLAVRGFKSLAKVDVELAPLVVLFGPNAAGKSNFLEALFLLSRLVCERTLTDAFGPPLRGYPHEAFRMPAGGLPALLAKPSAELTLEADLAPPANGAGATRRSHGGLRYRVGVRLSPKSGALELADENLTRLDKHGEPKHSPRVERESGGEGEERFIIRRTGEAGRPHFQPPGRNHTNASNLQFSGPSYPELGELRAELAAWRVYYLDPAGAMREAQPPSEVEDIGPRGQLIAPFLYRLKHAADHQKRYQAIGRALRQAIPSVEGFEVDLDPKRGTLDLQVVQGGMPLSSRIVSEGTLRVLALCSIAASPWPCRLVAFEEPENGVHPRRIEVIAELLTRLAHQAGRQVVVTSHSPTLVAAMARAARRQPDLVRLYACGRRGDSTTLDRLDPALPRLEDKEIAAALRNESDDGFIEAAFARGWLDGA